jgi:hypothetical protein
MRGPESGIAGIVTAWISLDGASSAKVTWVLLSQVGRGEPPTKPLQRESTWLARCVRHLVVLSEGAHHLQPKTWQKMAIGHPQARYEIILHKQIPINVLSNTSSGQQLAWTSNKSST